MTAGIAYVGCGYVADLYQAALANWSSVLDLRGGFDRDPVRLERFCTHHGLRAYPSLQAVLDDPGVSIVLNLTNPDQHFGVSKACLDAGKHVYSEKPLAMTLAEARSLVALAAARGLHIASAPCSVLGESAQTLWRGLRDRVAGRPRLIYAELDDGMVHRLGYENWRTRSGAQWPAEDEFRTGCTLEHAGYALTWLIAMFGPVRRVVSFAATLVPDKGRHTPAQGAAPDFSCACLGFDDGVVARLTSSIVAPHDHAFRVICEDGTIGVGEAWDVRAPVLHTPLAVTRLRRQLDKRLGWRGTTTLPAISARRMRTAARGYPMDFAIGPAEMAEAIAANRAPRLGGAFALHVTEVALAIQHPETFGVDYRPQTDVAPMRPMPWADV